MCALFEQLVGKQTSVAEMWAVAVQLSCSVRGITAAVIRCSTKVLLHLARSEAHAARLLIAVLPKTLSLLWSCVLVYYLRPASGASDVEAHAAGCDAGVHVPACCYPAL